MSNATKRPLAILAVSAAVLTAATGVLAEEVNVYSARHYDTDLTLYERFTAETGIAVNLIEGSGDELVERIQTEGANSPADVLITVDAGRLWRAEDAGLFQPVESAVLEERIPAHLRDPDGLWFGLAKRARVILYDKELGLPEGVATYEDLAKPELGASICIRSSSNVYNQSLIGSMIAAHGVEEAETWAAGVVANLAREPQGGDTDQIMALAAGECSLAVSNTYYLGRLIASTDPAEKAVGDRIGVIFPNQGDRGTHVNISGAGVLKGAPNRDAAVTFIEFLVGNDAQRLFADAAFEYPVVEGVPVNAVIAGFGRFKEDELNASVIGENNPEALRIADRVGWK